MNCRPHARTAGMVYIAVLAAMTIVLTLLLGTLLVGHSRNKAVTAASEMAEARFAALSGLEIARIWMNSDAAWRSTRPNGVWVTNLAVGRGTVTIQVTDPLDANISNRPHDYVVVRTTGKFRSATQIFEQTLTALPTALPVINYPVFSQGQMHIGSGDTVRIGQRTVGTNSQLRNDGIIDGNAEYASIASSGTIYGDASATSAVKALPGMRAVDLYAALGTDLPVTKLDKVALGPGYNPYGTANSDGVYVIRSTGDVSITSTRVSGTLVVICPGKKCTLGDSVFIEPSRSDYPAVIVQGDLAVNLDMTKPLSEATEKVSFNPPGVPYNGVSDATLNDQYPSEVRGLIHTTGSLVTAHYAIIRGAMIAESANSSDAFNISGDLDVNYPSAWANNPLQGYTSSVRMVPQANSIKQVVN